MPDLYWTAIIAAGAAIISSVLTSLLTYCFSQRQRRIEYELKWLEERFEPALDFLGKIIALISNSLSTPEGREQTAEEIHSIISGPTKDSNVWFIGTALDPEDTGLRDHVYTAMTYARIKESKDKFTEYLVKVQRSFEELTEEYRKERQAILKGQFLESLISERKNRRDKDFRHFVQASSAIKAYVISGVGFSQALIEVKKSGIRDSTLNSIFFILSSEDQQIITRLDEFRQECIKRCWLSGDIK